LQEKDHFEEEEADDLINFVENLDFDKFASDLRKLLESCVQANSGVKSCNI
jgi:hypothetical protein